MCAGFLHAVGAAFRRSGQCADRDTSGTPLNALTGQLLELTPCSHGGRTQCKPCEGLIARPATRTCGRHVRELPASSFRARPSPTLATVPVPVGSLPTERESDLGAPTSPPGNAADALPSRRDRRDYRALPRARADDGCAAMLYASLCNKGFQALEGSLMGCFDAFAFTGLTVIR